MLTTAWFILNYILGSKVLITFFFFFLFFSIANYLQGKFYFSLVPLTKSSPAKHKQIKQNQESENPQRILFPSHKVFLPSI